MAITGKSGRLLTDKLFRRERLIKTRVRSTKGGALDQYDKSFQTALDIDKSNRVERLMRKIVRRLQRSFSYNPMAHMPFFTTVRQVNVSRVVYGPSPTGHAIEIVFPYPVLDFEGFQPTDVVVFLNSPLKGKNLQIIHVSSNTTFLLQDVTTYTGPNTNITVRVNINNSVASYV